MGIRMEEGILISGFSRVIGSSVLISAGFALGGMDLIRHRKDYKDAGAADTPVKISPV